MTTAPPSVLQDLPFCFARAAHAFRRLGDHTLRTVGLDSQPPGMASVLHALAEGDNCPVSSLVKKTQLPNGTLTGLLDALEEDGRIERTDNPRDGRSWIIRLTPAGRAFCARLEERHKVVMSVFQDALTEEEAAELRRLLEKTTSTMRVHVGGGVAAASSRRSRKPVPKAP